MLRSSKDFTGAKVMVRQFHRSLWCLEPSPDRNGWPLSEIHGYCSLCLSPHLQFFYDQKFTFYLCLEEGTQLPYFQDQAMSNLLQKVQTVLWSVSFYPCIHSCVCVLPGSRHRAPTISSLLLLFSLWSEGTRPHSRYSTASITQFFPLLCVLVL